MAGGGERATSGRAAKAAASGPAAPAAALGVVCLLALRGVGAERSLSTAMMLTRSRCSHCSKPDLQYVRGTHTHTHRSVPNPTHDTGDGHAITTLRDWQANFLCVRVCVYPCVCVCVCLCVPCTMCVYVCIRAMSHLTAGNWSMIRASCSRSLSHSLAQGSSPLASPDAPGWAWLESAPVHDREGQNTLYHVLACAVASH